mmetsp:Transcript_60319/g.70506  ORF Transcript_60319/g.70506 Transcript_60319/m.70506 type:complete len:293 (+) Transcript_60319:505-1383(+)
MVASVFNFSSTVVMDLGGGYPASVTHSNVFPVALGSLRRSTRFDAKSLAFIRPTATSPCENRVRPRGHSLSSNFKPVGRTTQYGKFPIALSLSIDSATTLRSRMPPGFILTMGISAHPTNFSCLAASQPGRVTPADDSMMNAGGGALLSFKGWRVEDRVGRRYFIPTTSSASFVVSPPSTPFTSTNPDAHQITRSTPSNASPTLSPELSSVNSAKSRGRMVTPSCVSNGSPLALSTFRTIAVTSYPDRMQFSTTNLPTRPVAPAIPTVRALLLLEMMRSRESHIACLAHIVI